MQGIYHLKWKVSLCGTAGAAFQIYWASVNAAGSFRSSAEAEFQSDSR